jgi:hypothetical protein
MPVHLKPREINEKVSIKRLKMVLMIDEATTLVGMKFYNAFRWVIDQVIEPAWLLSWENSDLPEHPLPFTTIFMGTHSKVTQFLPPKHEASARYTLDIMKIPEPFTALDWDIEVPDEIKQLKRYNPLTYSSLADMTWLARFGRPCWMAQWGTSLKWSPESKSENANNIITLAEVKLHNIPTEDGFDTKFKALIDPDQKLQLFSEEERILTCSAIIGILAIINLDFFAPKRAAALVASRLRWALGCDKKRDFLLTTYPSEPVVAEAAFRLLFAKLPHTNQDFVLRKILEVVVSQVERGDYDAGGDGELCARILCLTPF